jgi:hypothetical protein
MLSFYGLQLATSDDAPHITKGATFTARAPNWLTPHNHNYLRLTRIIRSLDLLGRRDLAVALQSALEGIYLDFPDKIGPDTIRFWRSAIGA